MKNLIIAGDVMVVIASLYMACQWIRLPLSSLKRVWLAAAFGCIVYYGFDGLIHVRAAS